MDNLFESIKQLLKGIVVLISIFIVIGFTIFGLPAMITGDSSIIVGKSNSDSLQLSKNNENYNIVETIDTVVINKSITSREVHHKANDEVPNSRDYTYILSYFWMDLKDHKGNKDTYLVAVQSSKANKTAGVNIYNKYNIGDKVELSITDKREYIIDGIKVDTKEQWHTGKVKLLIIGAVIASLMFIVVKILERKNSRTK